MKLRLFSKSQTSTGNETKGQDKTERLKNSSWLVLFELRKRRASNFETRIGMKPQSVIIQMGMMLMLYDSAFTIRTKIIEPLVQYSTVT